MISHNRRVSGRDTQNVRRAEIYQGPLGPNMIIGGGQTLLPSSHSAPNPFLIQLRSPRIDPDQHQSVFPINTLPSELISEIFAHFVALEDPPGIATDAGPMLLLKVCRHWRALACGLPSLWSSFSTGRRDRYPHIALVEQWLAHAGPRTPLTLRFECLVFMGNNHGVALMDLFLAHAHHWREISLELDEILIERFERLQRGGAPVLEAAHLELNDIFSEARGAQQVFELLGSCERLTRLSLVLQRCLSPISAIPWEGLTWIHLECMMDLQMWIVVLSRCSNVVDLSVKGLAWPVTHIPIPETAPVLPHLRNLTIDFRHNAGLLLLYLAFPALESLSIAFLYPAGTLDHELDTVLRRSPLTKLTLLSVRLAEDTILACVSQDSFNSIRKLSLTSRLIGDDVARALTFSDKPGVEFLRGLENLTLGRYVGTRESFVQMMTSRCRPGKSGLARLRAVTVLEEESEYSEHLSYLAEYIILQQAKLG